MLWSSLTAAHLVSTSALEDCYTIVDSQQRLACYDQEMQARHKQPKASIIQTPPPTASVESKQQATPAPTAKKELGEKYLTSDNHKPESVNLALTNYYKDKQQRWVFEFDNNQVWRQIEAGFLKLPKKLPVTVKIQDGIFESYDMVIDGIPKRIKVTRLK